MSRIPRLLQKKRGFSIPPHTMPMEVLLLQDVPQVGKKDDLLVVGDGYAMNFLLPQSKAMIATPTVRRRYAEQIKMRALEREQERLKAAEQASVLDQKEITFSRKATKTGKLYAAITEMNIAEALQEQHSVTVKADAVTIAEPIKSVGEHVVSVTIGGTATSLKVTVTEEK